MLPRLITLMGLLALAWAEPVFAQSDGPAELPAPDYQGQSYIDTKGCIFLRAGYGGDVNWVPRVDQNRKPICGQTPTNEIARVADAAAVDAPATPVRRTRTMPVRTYPPKKPVMIGCPVSVPVARRYATTDGGSVVICTRSDGSLTGARSPIYPKDSGVGAALSSQRYAGVTIPLAQGKQANSPSASVVTPPLGYERAWKDDRLNPLRGKGTAEGEAAQDRILTRTVPAAAIAAPTKPAAAVVATTTPSAKAGGYFVQVGAFGEPANADGASLRLKALGLPVSRGKYTSKSKVLQIIYAGPFSSGNDARAALSLARGHGFSDAFLR